MKLFNRRAEETPTYHSVSVADEAVPPAEQEEQRKTFSEVEPLSEDFLRNLYKRGADGGKYIRLGDTIFVSSGPRQSFAGNGLQHEEILKRAMDNPDTKERMLGAEALQAAIEKTIGPDGMTDAGKFDTFFFPEDEPREDGIQGRFRVFGASASYGMADKKSRERTVRIASQGLGPHIVVEDAPHKNFS